MTVVVNQSVSGGGIQTGSGSSSNNQGGVVVAQVRADGVTDDTAAILAAINSLPAAGGTVLLPSGIIICNYLLIPNDKSVTLQGASRAGLSSKSGITGTRLQASGQNYVMTHIGASEGSRGFYLTLKDLSVWGNGTVANTIELKYTSYFRAFSCSFNNTSANWLKLWDVYDSRFYDCEFTFGGSADGTTYPGVECYSEGGSSATNEIILIGCRWESFAGAAIGLTGSNTFCIRILDFKMESGLSSVPFIKGSSSLADITICDGILTNTKASTTIPSLIDLSGATGVKIDCTMQVNGSATTVTNYVKIASSVGVDIKLRLLSSCPAPTNGYMVSWDGNSPGSFNARVLTSLTTPTYNYYFASQLSLIDSSMTSATPTTGTTFTCPPYISAVAITPVGTLAALTIALPAGATNGQQISFCFTQIITSLSVTHSASVIGAPSAATVGSFFTMRYFTQGNAWYRIG